MSNRYVNAMLKARCFPDIAELFTKCNNPMKEISESYAAFRHMRNLPGFERLVNYHIGDGKYCSTGILFSFMSKTINISIDPVIDTEMISEWKDRKRVSGFNYINNNWQDEKPYFYLNNKCINRSIGIVLVHSHINIYEIDKTIKWKYLYSNPCCNEDKQMFTVQYMKRHNIKVLEAGSDNNIISPKNMIFVYEKES